jgi:hypothetical protein
MAKVIGGKKYDPLTSELLADVDNNLPSSDFTYEKVAFYRKRTGEIYAIKTGLVWTVSSSGREGQLGPTFIVRTDKDAWDSAVRFLERWGGADDYEAVFGGVDEDEGKRQVAAWIPASIKDRADALDATIAEIFAAGVEALEERNSGVVIS